MPRERVPCLACLEAEDDELSTYLYTTWCFPAFRPVNLVPDTFDPHTVAYAVVRWLHFLVGCVFLVFWLADQDKLKNESEDVFYPTVIFAILIASFTTQFGVWRCFIKRATEKQVRSLETVKDCWDFIQRFLILGPCFLFWLGFVFWALEGDFIIWNKKEHLFTLTHQTTAFCGCVCILLHLEASWRRSSSTHLSAKQRFFEIVPLFAPVLLATLALAVFTVYDVIDRQDQTSYPHSLVLHLLVNPILLVCVAFSLTHLLLACVTLGSWLGKVTTRGLAAEICPSV